jgi:hypothetical protein
MCQAYKSPFLALAADFSPGRTRPVFSVETVTVDSLYPLVGILSDADRGTHTWDDLVLVPQYENAAECPDRYSRHQRI